MHQIDTQEERRSKDHPVLLKLPCDNKAAFNPFAKAKPHPLNPKTSASLGGTPQWNTFSVSPGGCTELIGDSALLQDDGDPQHAIVLAGRHGSE